MDGPPGPPTGVPIDGGLAILIAAGAYYGVKKSLKH
ncbi:PID-CTERM protein-sorting domain-containing protein [Formosa sp. 4Alg 33]